jgi:hypothetical protein
VALDLGPALPRELAVEELIEGMNRLVAVRF